MTTIKSKNKTVKPLLQALLDTEPLTSNEVREIVLRHVISSPHDLRNCHITDVLMEVFHCVRTRDTGPLETTSDHVRGADVYHLMKEHFVEGFKTGVGRNVMNADEFWVWPLSMSPNCLWPRDFIIMIGMSIGMSTGAMVAKDEKSAARLLLKN